jgi:hypothetical protein
MTRKLLALKPEYHHEVANALAARMLQRRRWHERDRVR